MFMHDGRSLVVLGNLVDYFKQLVPSKRNCSVHDWFFAKADIILAKMFF